MQSGDMLVCILYVAAFAIQQLGNCSPVSLRPGDQSRPTASDDSSQTEAVMEHKSPVATHSVTTRDIEDEAATSTSSAAVVVCGSHRKNSTTLIPQWLKDTCYWPRTHVHYGPASLPRPNTASECREDQWQEHLRNLVKKLKRSAEEFSSIARTIDKKTKRNCQEYSGQQEAAYAYNITRCISEDETHLTGRRSATSPSNRTAEEVLEIVYFRLSAAATILENLRELEMNFSRQFLTGLTQRRKKKYSLLAKLNEAQSESSYSLNSSMCVMDVTLARCGHRDACVATPEILPPNLRQLVGHNGTINRTCGRCHYPVMASVVMELFTRSIQEVETKVGP